MESLYPRWGGDHDLMEAFAHQSQAFAAKNPCVRWLLGFVDLDEGETLGLHGEYSKSIVVLTNAIHKGGDYTGFYFDRGLGYMYTGDYKKALTDFDRADKLSPQDPELLIRRAAAFAALNEPKKVLADLEFVKNFETQDSYWKELHNWAIDALKKHSDGS